jgi:heat shock protein HslJ
VRDVNGEPVPPGARATMVFGADGRLTGSSFCNSYSGTYSTTGEEITIGQTIVTRKACPPEVMKLEQAFLAVLRGTTRFAVKAGALSLRGTGSSALTAQR